MEDKKSYASMLVLQTESSGTNGSGGSSRWEMLSVNLAVIYNAVNGSQIDGESRHRDIDGQPA